MGDIIFRVVRFHSKLSKPKICANHFTTDRTMVTAHFQTANSCTISMSEFSLKAIERHMIHFDISLQIFDQ